MKKYINATINVVSFNQIDVMTASYAGNTYQDNELPLAPFDFDMSL